MTYQSEIEKIQAGEWAELYQFEIGGIVTYYTSHSEIVNHAGEEWLPRPIERGNLDNQEKLAPLRLNVKVPLDDYIQAMVLAAPIEPISVIIYRVILATSDSFEIFRGEVSDITVRDNIGDVVIESDTQFYKDEFPNFVYQARCQWSLFDTGCTLNESTYQVNATVTISSQGRVLTAAIFGAQPEADWFQLGYVRFQNDIRLITNHSGNDITIQAPFDSRLQTGGSVQAFPGCDKSRDHCQNKFSNFLNFTGFANIPSRNPVVWGLESE